MSPEPLNRLLEATARVEQHHFWFHGFRRFVRPLVEAAAAGRTDGDLLDCGCGTGVNLPMLARFGRAYGIDLAWTGLQYARSHGQPLTARASVAKLPFCDKRFDVVTSFDVLYCLPDEVEVQATTEMYRVLRAGGGLVVNVAALDVLRGNHSTLAGEVRRYTRATLRALLERAGFTIERLTYTNASLFPLMLAVRMAQRAAGIEEPDESGGELRVPAAPVNKALSAVLAMEAQFLRVMDMPVGSSLLCLARKPGSRA